METNPPRTDDASPSTETPPSFSAEAKSITKRYETLLTIRTKAVKSRKGAWYWPHLEPILVRNPETNLPRAVKLRCSLCDAVFSASNPSRTASEHLKRGACINPVVLSPTPISSSSGLLGLVGVQIPGTPKRRRLALSGGEKDLAPLAKLEDSVRRIKSLKKLPPSPPPPVLSNDQKSSAIELLSDWAYETCNGKVSVSSFEHPKFRSFLRQVGLPRMELLGERLDAKFGEAKAEVGARIREASFFQLACSSNGDHDHEEFVRFSANLPNGKRIFCDVVLSGGGLVVEEMAMEEVTRLCGNGVERCVGIVGGKCFKAKEMRNLEAKCRWMVNLSCQVKGILSLVKDFSKDLPVFGKVSENCLKVANFVNSESHIRSIFRKYRQQELGFGGLIRVRAASKCMSKDDHLHLYQMVEDVLSCSRVFRMLIVDDSLKMMFQEDPFGREISRITQSNGFWNDLELVYSLVKIIKEMAEEVESDQPRIGQCLPIWKELRLQVKDWCLRFNVEDVVLVEKIMEKRFRKNYHPAWSAAFVLDPLYLIRSDSTGKYLPPFNSLGDDQMKDVNDLVSRMASREEAHHATVELIKWRSEGLDPLYAQAVQVTERDPLSGKMKLANPQGSRLVWETCLSGEFKTLGKVAVRLIFLHATSSSSSSSSSGFNSDCSGSLSGSGYSRLSLERVQKMLFIAGHAELERQEQDHHLFEEDKDDDANRKTLDRIDMTNNGDTHDVAHELV